MPLSRCKAVRNSSESSNDLYARDSNIFLQESLALTSIARDDPPASSTAAAMCGKVGSEFET